MRNSIILLSVIILTACITTNSQEHLFTVIATKGKVTIKRDNSADWKCISAGEKLFSTDKIKLGAGNYIGLAHFSGRTIEVNTEGTFGVTEIAQKLSKSKNSLTSNFTKYVANEIASANIKTKNMKMLGAVVRAGMNFIDLNSPCNSYLSEALLNAAWFGTNAKSFVFHLLNPSGKTIYMQVLNDTSLSLDLKDFNVQKEACYKWFVCSGDNNTIISDTSVFTLAGTSRLKTLNDSLKVLKEEFDDPNSLLNKIIITSFYEKNKFYNDANIIFESIMKEASEVETFKDKYINFLTSAGMQRKAQIIFNQMNQAN